MQKYKLHVYGWEMESLAHSITNEQVQHIQELMKNNGYNELKIKTLIDIYKRSYFLKKY
jgi:hypothetical protein